ncbi:MAG: hypothetical protein AAFX99_04540 [Myxococcota bacterium]
MHHMDASDYTALLRQLYGDRSWIIATDVLASGARIADILRTLGATRALCIAGSTGTGDPPDPDFAPDPIVLGVKANSMMDGIRASLKALAHLPPEVQARIDTFDPHHTAQVYEMFLASGTPVGGRPVFGPRHPTWQQLEDKTVIDDLWRDTQTPHAPSTVVPATETTLRNAAQQLDQGMGTVWAGDNREGFHGGAQYLRWVRTDADATDAAEFLAQHCDRARVMPFLDGIPCSVHAMVFASETIAFRPCEMVVLRRTGRNTLHYARTSTFWDPRPEDRDTMRTTAIRIGDHLRNTLDYRGMFTLDGVMTAEGFRPTELNPRFGAAAGMLAHNLLPLMLLNTAVMADPPGIDWQPKALEALILAHADAHRAGSAVAMTSRTITETVKTYLVFDAHTATFDTAPDADSAHAVARLGPSPMGGYLAISFFPEHTPTGPHLAPRASAALAWADAAWDLGIGPLEPAPDLRPI